MNWIDKAILKIIQRKVSNWFDLERSLSKLPSCYGATDASPEKAWPNPDKIPLGGEVPFSIKNFFIVGKYLKSSIHQGVKAIQSLDQNPSRPKSTIRSEDLKTFENHATSLGIGVIGYTKLPRQLIFKDRAVLYDNVIVLLKESESNRHSWIRDFCDQCGRCIRTCPAKAINESPIIHASGRKTHITRDKCLPYFVNDHGCTVCIKECTFTQKSYEHIFKRFSNRKQNRKV